MLRRFIRFVSNNPLIAGLISAWLAAKLLTLTAADVGGVLGVAGAWLNTPEAVRRVNLLGLVLMSILFGMLVTVAIYLKQSTQLAPRVEPHAPQPAPTFQPETFTLTPPRCRALITMLHRIDQRTTLRELYQLVTRDATGDYVDPHMTKAQLQHDMDAAERAGLVSIERLGTLTQYFNLTIPVGRDWVLLKQGELTAEAQKGFIKRDLRSPFL